MHRRHDETAQNELIKRKRRRRREPRARELAKRARADFHSQRYGPSSVWPTRETPPLIRKRGASVEIPKTFSFIENAEETMEFIDHLKTVVANKRLRSLYIDHSHCKELDLCASLVMDTIIEQRRRSRTLALSGKFSDDDADAAHFSFSARQESARNSSEPRGHVVSVLVEAIHCFVNLREAVSVAGPRIILRDVLSGVPLSVASLTLPWNVISTDAIENWFWPENVRNPWT